MSAVDSWSGAPGPHPGPGPGPAARLHHSRVENKLVGTRNQIPRQQGGAQLQVWASLPSIKHQEPAIKYQDSSTKYQMSQNSVNRADGEGGVGGLVGRGVPAYMTVALLLNTRWHWSSAGTWWSRWKVLRSHWRPLLSRLQTTAVLHNIKYQEPRTGTLEAGT